MAPVRIGVQNVDIETFARLRPKNGAGNATVPWWLIDIGWNDLATVWDRIMRVKVLTVDQRVDH
jgi:hypothetical protein